MELVFFNKKLEARGHLFFWRFVFNQLALIKPVAILAFLDYFSLPAVCYKYIYFWRKTKVIISEDHFTSKITSMQPASKLRHCWIKLGYPRSNRVISCTKATKKDLVDSYQIAGEKVKVINNWTSFSEMKVKSQIKSYDFIYSGRLVETKDLLFLLDCMMVIKKVKPNIKLVILGEGEQRNKLDRFVNQNHMDKNVKIIKPNHNIVDYLVRSKIFVYTPKVNVEGFPLSVLEAMALGMPVLLKQFFGVEEVVLNSKNGFVIRSKKEFVAKAIELLGNKKLRKRVGGQARKSIRMYHSEANINKYISELGL